MAIAQEVKRFVITPTDAQDIVLNQDHLSVSLLDGWISAEDSFFKNLISKKSTLLVSVRATASFFEGNEKYERNTIHENSDIKKKTSRPWGVNIQLFDKIPAEASPSLEIRLAINRDDKVAQLFSAAQTAQSSLKAGFFASDWFGYSKLIGQLVSQYFGASRTSYPFLWTGDIKINDVASPTKMKEHYVLLIAPKNDSDVELPEMLASKFSYDKTGHRLNYDGKPVRDRSFAVLKVSREDPFDISNLLLTSSAPWSVLALSQLLVIPVGDAGNADQLAAMSKGLVKSLADETELLKREPRFSAYDRAVVLHSFATNGRKVIVDRCQQLNTGAACPTSELDQFINQISSTFKLTPQQKEEIKKEAPKVLDQMNKALSTIS